MTTNKASRVMTHLKADGWHRYPGTHVAIMTYAYKLDTNMTAKQIADCAIRLYQAYGAGKMQGELHGA